MIYLYCMTSSAGTPTSSYHYALNRSDLNIVTLFYDFIITLDQEMNNVWGRQFSIAGLLFFLNRYSSIVLVTANLLSFFPTVSLNLVSLVSL